MSRHVVPFAVGILLAPVMVSAGSRIDLVPVSPTVIVEADELERLPVTNTYGDIIELGTTNAGRIHVAGHAGAASSEYFRGVYGGDPDDLDEISGYASLIAAIEIIKQPDAVLSTLNFIAGMSNAIAEQPVTFGGSDQLWYVDDQYAGLLFGLGQFNAGVNYTVFNSPNGERGANFEEMSLAAGYTGDNLIGGIYPQAKAAVRTRGEPTGEWFLQGSVTPTFDLSDDPRIVLQFPMRVGIGFGEYYAQQAEDAIFAEVGCYASWRLHDSTDFGVWTAFAGADVLWRDDELVDLDPARADGDEWVVSGTIGIAFSY